MAIYKFDLVSFLTSINFHLLLLLLWVTKSSYFFVSSQQDELNLENENALSSPQRTSASSFVKILTPSDTSKHGGLSVPKRHADECFPPLVSILAKNFDLDYLLYSRQLCEKPSN